LKVILKVIRLLTQDTTKDIEQYLPKRKVKTRLVARVNCSISHAVALIEFILNKILKLLFGS